MLESLGKAKLLIEPFLVSILSIFAPIQSVLITVVVLIATDLVTGLIASKKRGEPVTSAALRRTMSKIFVYEIAVMISYITEHYMVPDLLPLVKMASTMIAVVELKSIYENLNSISGDQLLKQLVDKLGSDNK